MVTNHSRNCYLLRSLVVIVRILVSIGSAILVLPNFLVGSFSDDDLSYLYFLFRCSYFDVYFTVTFG